MHIDGKLVTTLGAGDCFGEGAIMSHDGQTRGGTMTALVNCQFAVLKEADFSKYVRTEDIGLMTQRVKADVFKSVDLVMDRAGTSM